MNYPNDLQYIFACLSTHSRWVDKIKNNFDEIYGFFRLGYKDGMMLRQFIQSDGQKMYASALLMEEKRWREVLLCIKYTAMVISNEQLRLYWRRYLEQFGLTSRIPASPILESIQFLTFILALQPDYLIASSVLTYELFRNDVLSFEYEISKINTVVDISMIKERLIEYRAIFNPSVKLKHFDYSVSKILEDLRKGGINKNISNYRHDEVIIFHKSIDTDSVRSIRLEKKSYLILLNLITSPNLLVGMGYLFKNNNINFLTNLIRSKLIFIEKLG